MIHADRTGTGTDRDTPTDRTNQLIYHLHPQCAELSSMITHRQSDRYTRMWVCVCVSGLFCIAATCGNMKCNSFADLSLLLRSPSATKMAATVTINCGILRPRSPIPGPDSRVPAFHCLISGVHYAVFELKLSWFTNEIIRHGRFFGNENSAIREIIFPAFVLFRLTPPHPALSCCLLVRVRLFTCVTRTARGNGCGWGGASPNAIFAVWQLLGCWAAGLDGAFSFDVVVALGWPGPGPGQGLGNGHSVVCSVECTLYK